MLKEIGYDPDTFKKERIQPLIAQGWEELMARAYVLIQESNSRDKPITLNYLESIGRDLMLYEGVPQMFEQLRECARKIVDDIEVEFSLGIVSIEVTHPAKKLSRYRDQC